MKIFGIMNRALCPDDQPSTRLPLRKECAKMSDLKYRVRLSTSVDKGLHTAIYNYSLQTGIPLSRILDSAIEMYLVKNGISYTKETPYKQEKR